MQLQLTHAIHRQLRRGPEAVAIVDDEHTGLLAAEYQLAFLPRSEKNWSRQGMLIFSCFCRSLLKESGNACASRFHSH